MHLDSLIVCVCANDWKLRHVSIGSWLLQATEQMYYTIPFYLQLKSPESALDLHATKHVL